MTAQGTKDPADREFDALLAALDAKAPATTSGGWPAYPARSHPVISDDMFESLMGELKGSAGNGETGCAGPVRPQGDADSAADHAAKSGNGYGRTGDDRLFSVSARARDPRRLAQLLNQLQALHGEFQQLSQQYAGGHRLREVEAALGRLTANLQIAGSPSDGNHYIYVETDAQRFSLPLDAVQELLPAPDRRTYVDQQWVLELPGRCVPAFSLREWWSVKSPVCHRASASALMLVIGGEQPIALQIDTCLGIAEANSQPLGRLLQGSSGLAGMVVSESLGSAIELDVPALVGMLREKLPDGL